MAIDFITWEKYGADPGPHGSVARLSPLVQRVIAPNEGPYTYTGSGTYLIGSDRVAVVDPGPDDSEHVESILRAVGRGRVSHIFVTHTHADHSPASRELSAATGAPILGCRPHPPDAIVEVDDDAWDDEDPDESDEAADEPKEEPGDLDFEADHEMAHGEVVDSPEWTMEAVATPGHISNHLCFGLSEEQTLFSGDHVMGWSTTVLPPPDGSLAEYMASLELVLSRDDTRYLPTHGPPVEDPQRFVSALLEHRRSRERQIVEQLALGVSTVKEIVAAIYIGLDKRLVKAAGASVTAHLTALVDTGMATKDGKHYELTTLGHRQSS